MEFYWESGTRNFRTYEVSNDLAIVSQRFGLVARAHVGDHGAGAKKRTIVPYLEGSR